MIDFKRVILAAIVCAAINICGVALIAIPSNVFITLAGIVVYALSFGFCMYRNFNFTQAAREAQAMINIAKKTVERNLYGTDLVEAEMEE